MIFEAQGAVNRVRAKGGSWARTGRDTEYRCLSLKLEQLARLPAIVVVVFDGPNRPKIKRDTRVQSNKEHYLSAELRLLADAFGFHNWTVSI